jgi:hypothetical protein
MEDEGEVARDGDAHAGAVLEFVIPDALEAGGEEIAGGGEHVEVEEREAVRVGGGEFAGEGTLGRDLSAESCGSELVAEGGERAVVFSVEAGAGGGLQEPGTAIVVSHIAGEASETGGVEPFQVVGEPLLDGGQVGLGDGFGDGEKGDGLGDFSEVYGFNDAFRATGFSWRDDLSQEKAWGHAGSGIDEPCS